MNDGLYWIDGLGTAHERCKLLFFVREEFLGEGEYDPGEAAALGYRRGGTLYVCRDCGDIWGRIVVIDSKGKQRHFHEVAVVACEKHHDPYDIPGSLLSGYRNFGYMHFMPEAVLKREFLKHINYAERELLGQSTGAQAA